MPRLRLAALSYLATAGPKASLTSGQTARSHPNGAGCNRLLRGQVLPGPGRQLENSIRLRKETF